MITKCPCCGADTDALPIEKLAAVVSDRCAEIVTILSRRPGEFVPAQDIATWVYRHDPDRSPLNIVQCLSQVISYNRPKMRAMGWDIQTRMGRHGGYKLIIHPEARRGPTS